MGGQKEAKRGWERKEPSKTEQNERDRWIEKGGERKKERGEKERRREKSSSRTFGASLGVGDDPNPLVTKNCIISQEFTRETSGPSGSRFCISPASPGARRGDSKLDGKKETPTIAQVTGAWVSSLQLKLI